jgi:hypothetical protein
MIGTAHHPATASLTLRANEEEGLLGISWTMEAWKDPRGRWWISLTRRELLDAEGREWLSDGRLEDVIPTLRCCGRTHAHAARVARTLLKRAGVG